MQQSKQMKSRDDYTKETHVFNRGIKEHINKEITNSLFQNLTASALSTLLIAFVLFFELKNAEAVHRKFYEIWFISVLFITLFRLIVKRWFHSRKENTIHFFYILFFIGAILTASCFGALGSVLMPNNMDHQAFILIIISGLLAGSVQSLSPSYIINITYLLLILIPVLIWELVQIYHGKIIYMGIFTLMALYCIFSIIIAHRNYKMLITNIKLKYENEKMNELLEVQATHDALTGLCNRFYLHDHLKLEISNCKRVKSHLSIIMIDVDKFKHYNDQYGHEVGDEVLRILGQFLKENIRGADFASRFGGDEFILVLGNTEKEIAFHRAEELQNKAKDLVINLPHQQSEQIKLSMGIATYPEDAVDEQELIKQADSAMYDAKHSDEKNIVVYKKK